MAAPTKTLVAYHGIRAPSLPPSWEDHTVHKYAGPAEQELNVPPLMQGAKPPRPPFRSNLVVTKHRLPEPLPLETVFEGPNHANRQQLETYKVLRSGVGDFHGQQAAWQDVQFFEPAARLEVYQRQIGCLSSPTELVVFTLTSSQDRLEDLGDELDLVVTGG